MSLPGFSRQVAPAPLTNQRIIDLVHSGLRAEELMRLIQTAPQVSFLLTPAETDRMLQSGVSEEEIKTMAARENGAGSGVVAGASGGTSHAAETGGNPRVFVTDSPNAWSANSGWWAIRAGSHPQTAEIMKTINQRCSGVTVTNNRQNANYLVILERESSKVLRRDNKMVVFNQVGDLVYSASTRALGNAVKGACASFR